VLKKATSFFKLEELDRAANPDQLFVNRAFLKQLVRWYTQIFGRLPPSLCTAVFVYMHVDRNVHKGQVT
jgi:hypothetical protein